MSQQEELLKLQKVAISELQTRKKNFEKDSSDKKNIAYYERRIIRLDDWWQSFKYRNTEILRGEVDPDQPYIKYESAKNIYHQHRNQLREELTAIAGENYDEERNDSATPSTSLTNGEMNDRRQETQIVKQIDANAILKILLDDVNETITTINEMSNEESISSARVQVDLLKETWSTFKNKYYEEKAKDNNIKFDMATQQKAYIAAMSKLDDKINHRESNHKKAVAIDLPKIKLPEFNGKATEWRAYIELFDEICKSNGVTDAMKMQYLKMTIKGDAAKLISVAPTAENYKTCRGILEKRYNNKRELVGKLIDVMLNLPKMKNETSEDLRKIHDTANECLLSIENMGMKTDNWDPLVIHILLQKLAKETIKHYEFQLSDTREI